MIIRPKSVYAVIAPSGYIAGCFYSEESAQRYAGNFKESAMMEWRKKPNLCRIKAVDNMSLLTMPDGTIVPAQIFTRVTQVVNERPYAIVKVFVNLDDTIDEPNTDNNGPESKD